MEKPRLEWFHKIRVCDKTKMLDSLAKHFGLIESVVKLEGDWKQLAARLASARLEEED